eukprot:gene21966-29019_t
MGEIKYSPPGGPGILAAGSQDMGIYLYNVRKDYHFIGRCTGHSGTIQHLDWTLPISLPGHKLHGEMLFMAADASGNIMYWNPNNIMYWNPKSGFGVMGIWPDNSGPDDINAECRKTQVCDSMEGGLPDVEKRVQNTQRGKSCRGQSEEHPPTLTRILDLKPQQATGQLGDHPTAK